MLHYNEEKKNQFNAAMIPSNSFIWFKHPRVNTLSSNMRFEWNASIDLKWNVTFAVSASKTKNKIIWLVDSDFGHYVQTKSI